jgi:TRAP-type C4-dicarboxylate transport system permease small subunit
MKLLALQIPDANGNPINIQGAGGMPQGGVNELPNAINGVFNLLLLAAVLLSLMFLIWGGINWMMSEGDKQKISQARQKIVYSILGLIIAFAAFLIINTVYAFFFGNKLIFSH